MIAKISVIFLALLIPCINAGLLYGNPYQYNLADTDISIPSTGHFSFADNILCTISDISVNDNPVVCKSVKYLKKVKPNWNIKTISSANSNCLFPLMAEEQDPSFLTDLFDIPDISFPFDYFW